MEGETWLHGYDDPPNTYLNARIGKLDLEFTHGLEDGSKGRHQIRKDDATTIFPVGTGEAGGVDELHLFQDRRLSTLARSYRPKRQGPRRQSRGLKPNTPVSLDFRPDDDDDDDNDDGSPLTEKQQLGLLGLLLGLTSDEVINLSGPSYALLLLIVASPETHLESEGRDGG